MEVFCTSSQNDSFSTSSSSCCFLILISQQTFLSLTTNPTFLVIFSSILNCCVLSFLSNGLSSFSEARDDCVPIDWSYSKLNIQINTKFQRFIDIRNHPLDSLNQLRNQLPQFIILLMRLLPKFQQNYNSRVRLVNLTLLFWIVSHISFLLFNIW